MSASLFRQIAILSFFLVAGCADTPSESGHVLDEARLAHRTSTSFPAAGEDYFHGMDSGIALSADEIKGRDMWIVWTGGDDRFWDKITQSAFGSFDLLKIVSSYPNLKYKYSRDNRFAYFGVINEPCFDSRPNPTRRI
jgi:hypothetical protein